MVGSERDNEHVVSARECVVRLRAEKEAERDKHSAETERRGQRQRQSDPP